MYMYLIYDINCTYSTGRYSLIAGIIVLSHRQNLARQRTCDDHDCNNLMMIITMMDIAMMMRMLYGENEFYEGDTKEVNYDVNKKDKNKRKKKLITMITKKETMTRRR